MLIIGEAVLDRSKGKEKIQSERCNCRPSHLALIFSLIWPTLSTPTAQSMGIRASRSSEKTHHKVRCGLGCGSAAIAGLRRSRGRSHKTKFPMVRPDYIGRRNSSRRWEDEEGEGGGRKTKLGGAAGVRKLRMSSTCLIRNSHLPRRGRFGNSLIWV